MCRLWTQVIIPVFIIILITLHYVYFTRLNKLKNKVLIIFFAQIETRVFQSKAKTFLHKVFMIYSSFRMYSQLRLQTSSESIEETISTEKSSVAFDSNAQV